MNEKLEKPCLCLCPFEVEGSVVWFSEYRSFTSLVRFIPRYFIFLVAISNEIFSWFLFLIFHCWCTKMPLISEYWLCILLFCQIHLWGWGWVVFLVGSIRFSMYIIMSSTNSDILLPPFQFRWLLFLFLSDCCGKDFQYYVE